MTGKGSNVLSQAQLTKCLNMTVRILISFSRSLIAPFPVIGMMVFQNIKIPAEREHFLDRCFSVTLLS